MRGTNSLQGRIKREVEAVHLVANHLTDLSAELPTVGERDAGFPLPHLHFDSIKVKNRDFK
jgi:error-prone DNA polymerase